MVAAVSPPLMFGWSLDDIMVSTIEQNKNMMMMSNILGLGETETSDDSLLRDNDSPSQDNYHRKQEVRRRKHLDVDDFSPPEEDHKTVKKLNHNASERDRRKRINGMYSSLRSLLPQPDQMKKLSIPATVSRVLKYIPELQKELESLEEKKEGLMKEKKKKIGKQENSCSLLLLEKQRKDRSSSSVVSATRLGEKDIMIQISTTKNNRGSFGHLLSNLEQDGFVLQDSSSFESFDERIFYNLHLHVVEGTQVIVDLEDLKEKLSIILREMREEPSHLNFGYNNLLGFCN